MAEADVGKKEVDPQKKPVQSRGKGCCAGCAIALSVFLIVGVVGLFFAWKVVSEKLSALSLPATPILDIDAGTAQKKSGNSWIPMLSGEALTDGETVKTLAKSQVSITFPNGSQTRLDENTQVTINPSSQGIALTQTVGRTWSRVTGLLGRTSYEIETPTVVATIRGTAFSTTVSSDETNIDVDENSVDIAAIETVAGKRSVLARLVVDAGYSTRVRKIDLPDLRNGKKKLTKEVIREAMKNSDWFKNNRVRDKQIVKSLRKHGLNPLEIFNLARSVSPGDLVSLKNFVQKLENGEIHPSEKQAVELEAIGARLESATTIDASLAADAARALAILDPVSFSDTQHWTSVLSKVLPYYKILQSLPQGQE